MYAAMSGTVLPLDLAMAADVQRVQKQLGLGTCGECTGMGCMTSFCLFGAPLQARQLLLDPAVAAEFERLRGEAEAAAREARGLREELQAAHFSQESKAGRLLMAKCRALQVRGSRTCTSACRVLVQKAACTRSYWRRTSAKSPRPAAWSWFCDA